MSVPELERYHPSERGLTHAFDSVIALFPDIATVDDMQSQPIEEQVKVTHMYTMAGISFLANHSDLYINTLGTAMISSILQGQIAFALTEDMQSTLVHMGLSDVDAAQHSNVIPLLVNANENATLIVPTPFAITAREKPIIATSNLMATCSLGRDFINGRLEDKNDMSQKRTRASVAQLLLVSAREIPKIVNDDTFQSIRRTTLDVYPQGINSLPGGRYNTPKNQNPLTN